MRQGVVVSLFVSALLFVPPLYAGQHGGRHHGVPFANLSDQIEAVQSSVDALQGDVSGLQTSMAALQASIDGLNAAVSDINDQLAAMQSGYTVQTSVDTATCATVPVQCAGPGHSYTPADSTNHNPLRMFVQVVDAAGLPVNGLTLDNFNFSNNFVPAGASGAVVCTEADCGIYRFQATANGLYSIYLDHNLSGNWKAGSYAGTVVVNNSGKHGASMVNFTLQ